MTTRYWTRCGAITAALLVLPGLLWGAGFALFEHGNRGMAMGGAMTAIADDPSANYWNPAGLSFQEREGLQIQGGATFIIPDQDFEGVPPYPGFGYKGSQEDQLYYPPHFYLVMPINDQLTLGGGFFTPYGLGTWWPDDFPGRFISKRVDLKMYNLDFNISYKVSEMASVALGINYAAGQIDLTRSIGQINPYTQQLTDIGQIHMYTDGLGNGDFGWNAGVMLKLGGGFTFGASYRSAIEIEFEGEASFVQYPTGYADYDALIAQLLPFDENIPLETAIEFPDYLSLGLSWSNDTWVVGVAYGQHGWEVFDELPITFPTRPDLSSSVLENYEDTEQYRLGVEYKMNETWALRAGLLFDETPQPKESMSPLLGDADRTGYSIGIGWTHDRTWVDVGWLYLPFDDRGTDGLNYEQYNGNYETMANLFGVTIGMTF